MAPAPCGVRLRRGWGSWAEPEGWRSIRVAGRGDRFAVSLSNRRAVSGRSDSLAPYNPAVAFFVYMARCADGSYYIGQTNNLEQRVELHRGGFGGAYTHKRRPVSLAWHAEFPTRIDAVACERQIKRWSQAKKEALADGDWSMLSLLAWSRGSTGSPRTDEGGTWCARCAPRSRG